MNEMQELTRLQERVRVRLARLRAIVKKLPLYELVSVAPNVEPAHVRPSSRQRPTHLAINNYGTLGTLNTGEVLGSIHSHASTVTGLSADAFREAVDALATAIAKDQALSENRRKEALESIDALAEEAGREPEKRRSGVLRGMMLAIPGAIELSANALQAWDKYGPAIQTHLDQLMK
jgi:hypothetical protein